MGDMLNLMLSLTWYGILIRVLFWIGVIITIVHTVRAIISIAKSQIEIAESLQEISIKIGKQNAILANQQTTGNSAQSFRDTGAGAGQSSEPATAPEQWQERYARD